jgi:CO/xanthine dehydrogenase Mo-binding subunit
MRAFPLAELTVLIDSALGAAGVNRADIVRDDRVAAVLLSSCAQEPESGALAGAHVVVSPESGAIEKVEVRVAAGDPLDEVVLRSYCVGAAHMALSWVLRESLTVDSETGEVLDLTIRSFDILPAGQTPLVEVAIIDDPGAARPYARDAVFAAVAAAITQAAGIVGTPIESFPADTARGQRLLGR